MSVIWTNKVWKFSRAVGSNLTVLLAIADSSNEHGICYPKVETLAVKSRLSVRQVQRILPELEEKGEIEVVRRRGRSLLPLIQLTLKGDIRVTFSEKIKGDILTLKGDTETLKGDIQGNLHYKERARVLTVYEPSMEPSMGGSAGASMSAREEKNPPPPNKKNILPFGQKTQAQPAKQANVRSADKGPQREKERRIHEDFGLTAEMASWGAKHTPNVDLEFETLEYKTFWRSADRNAEKSDWLGNWQIRMLSLERHFRERQREINLRNGGAGMNGAKGSTGAHNKSPPADNYYHGENENEEQCPICFNTGFVIRKDSEGNYRHTAVRCRHNFVESDNAAELNVFPVEQDG